MSEQQSVQEQIHNAGVAALAASKSGLTPITCPKCAATFDVTQMASFKDGTVLTMLFKMESGHMLQASTLGGSIDNMGKLLKAAAKHLCDTVPIEVLVKDVRFAKDEIAVDFKIVMVATDKRKKARKPKLEGNDAD